MLNILKLALLLCYCTASPLIAKNTKAPEAIITFQLFVDSPSQSYSGLDASIKNENTGVIYTPQSFQIISGRGVFQFGVAGEIGEVFSLTVKSGTTTVASGTYTITATNTNQHYVATTVYMSY